jgi:hypothetical protein
MEDRVLRDIWLLDTVRVPEVRPTFVVGRRLFAGRHPYRDLARETELANPGARP